MEGEKSDCTWYTKNDKAISYLKNSFSTGKHIQSGPRFANFIRFEEIERIYKAKLSEEESEM